MKFIYTTLKGKLVVEFEANDTKTMVENLAHIQEVCEQSKCENCGKNDFKFVVRNVEDDKYYELGCKNCGFKLGFGIPKKGAGNLYPRRSNHKTKEPIGKFGWHQFKNDRDDKEENE